ncbi:MAG: hypothetical protein IT385_17785 [Deltaproteobacteria bacterium]|nr:hypothetical protein [Deltaproteobacteria bacterium]
MRRLTTFIMTALVFTLAACAGAERADDDDRAARADEPVLIASGGPFEIHLRDGRVIQLIPSAIGEPPIIKPIRSLDELRTLYETSRGEPMPAPRPGGGVALNGWVGLECVRAGHACGPAPEHTPQAMVVVIFD